MAAQITAACCFALECAGKHNWQAEKWAAWRKWLSKKAKLWFSPTV
jgi:hypothetical protein